jgi:hypothetical protein
MNKFNPKEVPDWCKWIAVDKDGECLAYSAKPVNMTDPPLWVPKHTGVMFETLYKGKPPKNWKDELYTWGY